ncbi:hypothetical protein [Chamaesiphon sp. VAR_48_metabat_135_sub]|uniref:hypothetical protein n=1 Tax=Chamaesiphon sp. VAR_48_metabat_135_sub TaxID=2964699 RepID=UPI00286B533C|nr:hypothetical protein [Chamaesiphon sp. VAR_48_metabat_135_sub]
MRFAGAETHPTPYYLLLITYFNSPSRSPNPRRTYTKALVDFFMQVANSAPTPQLVGEFLALDRRLAPYDRLKYKGRTIAKFVSAID